MLNLYTEFHASQHDMTLLQVAIVFALLLDSYPLFDESSNMHSASIVVCRSRVVCPPTLMTG